MFCLTILPYILNTYKAQDWPTTNGQLISSKVESQRSDDSTTYRIVAKYTYTVEGVTYTSDQVDFNNSSDSFKKDYETLNRTLKHNQEKNGYTRVYYDPKNPANAVLSVKLRTKYILFVSGFLFLFFSVGVGLVWAANYVGIDRFKDSTGIIRNTPAGKFWLMLVISVVFIGLSAIPAMMYEEQLQKQNYWFLLTLLFPLIGLSVVWNTLKILREWMRFGEITVRLDPYPGSVGGDVAGVIELKEPFSPDNQYEVALACFISSDSKSESNNESSEKLLWQEEGIAHAESTVMGTLLRFAFSPPNDLPPTRIAGDEDAVNWHLYVSASLPGPDLDRDILINVQNDQPPRKARRRVVYSKDLVPNVAPPKRVLRITEEANETTYIYPATRARGMGISLLFVGFIVSAIGAGAGYLALNDFVVKTGFNLFGLAFAVIPTLISLVFVIIGIIILLCGLHLIFNTKIITISPTKSVLIMNSYVISSTTKSFSTSDFTRLALKQNSSTKGMGKSIVYYEIQGFTKAGKKVNLGDALQGSALAERTLKHLYNKLVENGADLEPLGVNPHKR